MDAEQAPLFTMEDFLEQVDEPLIIMDLWKPLPAFILQKYYRRFTNEISRRCNSFIGKAYKRPKLPFSQQFCSIAFRMDKTANANLVRVCFRLSDLYCLVALNGNGKLYQVGKSGTTRKITQCATFLGKEETYGKLLSFISGSKLNIKGQSFVRAYHSFMNLGTPKEDFDEASFGIGIVALAFMEPCRQATPKAFLVGLPGKYHSSEEYGTLVYGSKEWEIIHSWEDNSLAAEGMKAGKDGMVWTNDNRKTIEAQEEVLIVNSNPDAPPMPSILGETAHTAQ